MPSLSLFLGVGAILTTLSSPALAAVYEKEERFTGANWLDGFQFETYELTNGYVNYVDEHTAKSSGLYKIDGDDVIFGADSTETLDATKSTDIGRKSVRLEGKTDYNHGLFVLDVKAVPSVCGMWPSFWSLGREPWPVKGEIDIIEGVNKAQFNKYVLHTDTSCKVDGLGQTGAQSLYDCALDGPNQAIGCDVNEVRPNSVGDAFNSNGGGIYAMEWDSDAIKMWFFPRGSAIPASLSTSEPDTSEFGIPAANFKGDCNIDQRFKDQRFIFTNTFCGDWAGNVYAQSECPKYYDNTGRPLDSVSMCKKFVAENPQAFKDAQWRVSSFKTYQKKVAIQAVLSSSSEAQTSTHLSSSVGSSSTPVPSSSVDLSNSPIHPSSSSALISSSAVQTSSSDISLVSSSPSSHASSTSLSVHIAGSSPVIQSISAVQDTHVVNSSDASSLVVTASSAGLYPIYPAGNTSAHYPGTAYPASSAAPNYAIYNESYGSAAKSTPITTTYTTTYVDVCETGYTTITTMHTVTYSPSTTPAANNTGQGYPAYPPPGFEVTTKVCNKGCGDGPKTVTVTVPCTKCGGVPSQETGKKSIAAVPTKPACNGYDCENKGVTTVYAKVYSTKVITLTKIAVPESEYNAQYPFSAVYGGDKPSVPTYGTDKPTQTPAVAQTSVGYTYPAKNGTTPYGTGVVKPSAPKTGYNVTEFTGAAVNLEAGGMVAVAAFAAFFV